jgi:hypothetical protein
MNTLDIAVMNAAVRQREIEASKPVAPPPAPTKRDLATQAEQSAIRSAQARADAVLAEYGRSAPLPVGDEALFSYRQRLLNETRGAMKLRPIHLTGWDDGSDETAETCVYVDAMRNAKDPHDLPVGQVREIIKMDRSGRAIHEFVGRSQGTFKTVFGHCIATPMGFGAPCVGGVEQPLPYLPGS